MTLPTNAPRSARGIKQTSDEGHRSSLAAAGLRVTEQRLAVLRALEERPGAMTAQELHSSMRLHGSNLGLATIYRTLAALADAGEVERFTVADGQAFKRCGPEHHHHLVCESCGSVEEIDAREVEDWVARVSRRRRFVVTRHVAEVFGRCAACSTAGDPSTT